MKNPPESESAYLSPKVWGIYTLLLTVSVPWYWQFIPGVACQVWLGLPAWVFVAVVSSFGVSLFTAQLLWRTRWPDEESEGDAEL